MLIVPKREMELEELYAELEKAKEVDNMVVHPPHYTFSKYEVKDIIREWGMNFALGSAIKYVARCEHKGNKRQDLEKAIFFIQDELNNMDNE